MTTTSRNHRITAAERRYIRKAVELRCKLSNKALARKFGVSQTVISRRVKEIFAQGRPSLPAVNHEPRAIGRPRCLSPEQEQRVADMLEVTTHNHKGRVYGKLSREFGVGISTLKKALYRRRKLALTARVKTNMVESYQESAS